ncbi:MAG: hypothetical protein D3917_19290, partial [Candidatus Electrothrix sp. AX5]|nr:hypothetical protein [Candidatus Electrothrix sp. AX5]
MGDTFGNSSFNSNGGTQNNAQGTGAVGQQNNNFAPQQVSTDELITLLGQVQRELSRLPLDGPVKVKVKDDV